MTIGTIGDHTESIGEREVDINEIRLKKIQGRIL